MTKETYGSPWDKISAVEQEATANIDRIDAVCTGLLAQLRALDARLVKLEESKKVTARKKSVS